MFRPVARQWHLADALIMGVAVDAKTFGGKNRKMLLRMSPANPKSGLASTLAMAWLVAIVRANFNEP